MTRKPGTRRLISVASSGPLIAGMTTSVSKRWMPPPRAAASAIASDAVPAPTTVYPYSLSISLIV